MLRRKISSVSLVVPVGAQWRCAGDGFRQNQNWGGQIPNHTWAPDKKIRGIMEGDDRMILKEKGLEGERSDSDPATPPQYKSHTDNPTWKHREEWPKEWDDPSQAIRGATGADNKPGAYATNEVPRGTRYEDSGNKKAPEFVKADAFEGAKWRADNINFPEFKTAYGDFERRRFGSPADKETNKRQYPMETVSTSDVQAGHPASEHHPFFDYTNPTGKRENNTEGSNNPAMWDLKRAMKSLYKSALIGLPLVKQFYFLQPELQEMARRVKERFYMNKHVKDTDAVRSLLYLGWIEYQELITFRKQKAGVLKFFSQSDTYNAQIAQFTKEEGKLIEERKWWEGEGQRREGPFEGFWSLAGKQNYEEFQKLKGRVPMGWHSSKYYFEQWKCDGTNVWEKNLDYEGWFIKNVDPDRQAARKEIQTWICSGYQQPKHYASKNRRSYRRLVKDLETVMNSPVQELYAACREQHFQNFIKEDRPETNRIHAEKQLTRLDDDIFTAKWEEYDRCLKQTMREFPNPRLWKTDAFYLRFRELYWPFHEFNWAKAPLGENLERLYSEWISNTVNYAVINSPQWAAIKADKQRNPMAKTWGDFYTEFDPDKPETRKLPWYHPDFDYDRRHFWDEKCMRMKKWVGSGDVDVVRPFFEAGVYEWEQHVNRGDGMREANYVYRKFNAARMTQLYRALIKRNDVALTNQMVETLAASYPGGLKALMNVKTEQEVQALLDKHDWSKFRFEVPVVIYPDGAPQPSLTMDGTPAQEAVAVAA